MTSCNEKSLTVNLTLPFHIRVLHTLVIELYCICSVVHFVWSYMYLFPMTVLLGFIPACRFDFCRTVQPTELLVVL